MNTHVTLVSALNDLLNIMKFHITHSATTEQHWPEDAVYRVVYSTKTPPQEFIQNYKYFANASLMCDWHREQLSSAAIQKNHFEVDCLYMWDQCPIRLVDISPHFARISAVAT